MPYQWTAERERRMLLFAISSANLRPSADTWQRVASLLGEGLTASAVSQKYYKLRNEMAKLLEDQGVPTPTTPTKRKAEDNDDEKKTPPSSKRVRKPKQKSVEGIPFRDESESPHQKVKYEDMAVNVGNGLDSFHSYGAQFTPVAAYFPAVNMGEMMSGHQRSGNSSDNSFMA
ncbi:uncharacterized protein Z520_04859 [Fonsecaea multimorphosa CBS 102226]|uniref:Myb-like domain-containing protein n=1 Tax=Fonsecaea multimorphosa CBS 102226 TaxID=1442371 RepID=A0A0D2KRD7_9EURO|nr:uncharacterized protein Z520_04859 [Fonsecaea multimorphosa CBS 102226]KIX99283.1 hypothetical protein Z520_04859 [Fonsecaea multimorphosa CBS 102226]OAL25973.1 hypothetical protein AYO22_04600 [Fonsecaea multimorphosa]